jgi:hypothetical protein
MKIKKIISCPYCFKNISEESFIQHLIHHHDYPSSSTRAYVQERLAQVGYKNIFET